MLSSSGVDGSDAIFASSRNAGTKHAIVRSASFGLSLVFIPISAKGTDMKAALYRRFGKASDVLELVELDTPAPGPGEVRVKLAASGVNPSDVKSRAGLSRPMTAAFQIPGSDGAGVIDAVGEGVSSNRIGERVWTYNAAFFRPFGTSAEYVVLPEAMAPSLPPDFSFEQGACLGVPVMTAHRCLFADGPLTGQRVLVTGGAGVVGHYAIQLAKWRGAEVISTVSSDAKAAHAKRAGADYVIDYKTEDVVGAINRITGERGVDRIVDVDFGANLPVSAAVIAPGGTIASYASMGAPTPAYPFYALFTRNATVRNVLVYSMSDAAKHAAIQDINEWAASGKTDFAIAHQFPLAQIGTAHETVEHGSKIGHVVLTITSADD